MKNKVKVLGVMSGTSLDGLDLALVEFSRRDKNSKWHFQLMKAATVSYSKSWKSTLKNSINLKGEELQLLDLRLGEWIGEKVNDFLKGERIDFIASHGHTVHHRPEEGVTIQIGAAKSIHQVTKIPVINNFRKADVQSGGQGAPLVPIGDRDLFPDFDMALNLGGIANISFDHGHKRIAFDICPFNMALNTLVNQLGIEYDKGGSLAKTGEIDKDLLFQLNHIDYLRELPPKSLGLEDFQKTWKPIILGSENSVVNKMATYVEHCAQVMGKVINEYQGKSVLVTGGGAYHEFFIELLRNQTTSKIVIPEPYLVEFKEALVFAYLGVLRIEKKPNCLSSVTGAKEDICGGDLTGF